MVEDNRKSERSYYEKKDEYNEKLYYKFLKLITGEAAIELGISTESPVFVSPYVTENKQCDECGIGFTPLVYQSGYVINAQHFHQQSGGVYFFKTSSKIAGGGLYGFYFNQSYSNSEWVALLSPIGKVYKQEYPGEINYRAESAQVLEIIPVCKGRQHPWGGHYISEGVVTKPNYEVIKGKGNLLYPKCLEYPSFYLDSVDPYLSFFVINGQVLFRPLERGRKDGRA